MSVTVFMYFVTSETTFNFETYPLFFFSIFTVINQTRFPTHVPRILGTRLRRFHDQFNNKELKLYRHNWISTSLLPIENLSRDLKMLKTNTCNITEALPH